MYLKFKNLIFGWCFRKLYENLQYGLIFLLFVRNRRMGLNLFLLFIEICIDYIILYRMEFENFRILDLERVLEFIIIFYKLGKQSYCRYYVNIGFIIEIRFYLNVRGIKEEMIQRGVERFKKKLLISLFLVLM